MLQLGHRSSETERINGVTSAKPLAGGEGGGDGGGGGRGAGGAQKN